MDRLNWMGGAVVAAAVAMAGLAGCEENQEASPHDMDAVGGKNQPGAYKSSERGAGGNSSGQSGYGTTAEGSGSGGDKQDSERSTGAGGLGLRDDYDRTGGGSAPSERGR